MTGRDCYSVLSVVFFLPKNARAKVWYGEGPHAYGVERSGLKSGMAKARFLLRGATVVWAWFCTWKLHPGYI